MIRFSLLIFLSLSISFPAYSLSDTQRKEMQKTIRNMSALLPRRIDAMTTVTSTWMQGDTWYMNTTINIGGRSLGEFERNSMKTYIQDQYCRPPYEYLDAGLVIANQYYDENNNYLFTALANKSICGR